MTTETITTETSRTNDPSRPFRLDVAQSLSDVLTLSDQNLTENQRSFASDLLAAMVPYLPQDFLEHLALVLSFRRSLSPELARAIILQPITIARPLLESIWDLSDGLLMEAISLSRDHQRVIAGRYFLSESVADALYAAGDARICIKCLLREDVPLAPHRIAALVERSKTEQSLRAPLLNRRELKPNQGFAMFWWLNAKQRSRILHRFRLTRAPIQEIFTPLYVPVFTDDTSDPVAKGILSLCDRRHRPRNAEGEVVSLQHAFRIVRAARKKFSDPLCGASALLAGISPSTMRRILLDNGGEPFAIYCKSLGISRTKFSELLTETQGCNSQNLNTTAGANRQHHLIVTFDTIATDYARTVLRYWDWHNAMDQMVPETPNLPKS